MKSSESRRRGAGTVGIDKVGRETPTRGGHRGSRSTEGKVGGVTGSHQGGSRTRIRASIAVAWIAILYWGEIHSHRIAQDGCQWPEMNGGRRVMVVADPQLVDEYTYKQLGNGSYALAFTEAVCDAYVKRAFRTAVRKFQPQVFLFLGDLFGQGARSDDSVWHRLRRRVDAALYWPRDNGASRYLNVAGNHDVGYSEVIRHYPGILARFEKWYGTSNFVERIGGVDFVGVNAMVLDGRGSAAEDTWAFIDGLARNKGERSVPRVLLTHLPLPNPLQKCGPHRNSAVIAGRRLGGPREIMYQDYLSEETTRRLLETVEPELILSGHDHDQCEVRHVYTADGGNAEVNEITVGTFSALNGNVDPSFLMLSIGDDSGRESAELIQHKLCFLPSIRKVAKVYRNAGVFCILFLLGLPIGELITTMKSSDDSGNALVRARYGLYSRRFECASFCTLTDENLLLCRRVLVGVFDLIVLLIFIACGFILLLARDSMILQQLLGRE